MKHLLSTTTPSLAVPGQKAGPVFTPGFGYNTAAPNTALHPNSVSPATNSNLPLDVRQPVLALNYIICIHGIYPSKS